MASCSGTKARSSAKGRTTGSPSRTAANGRATHATRGSRSTPGGGSPAAACCGSVTTSRNSCGGRRRGCRNGTPISTHHRRKNRPVRRCSAPRSAPPPSGRGMPLFAPLHPLPAAVRFLSKRWPHVTPLVPFIPLAPPFPLLAPRARQFHPSSIYFHLCASPFIPQALQMPGAGRSLARARPSSRLRIGVNVAMARVGRAGVGAPTPPSSVPRP